MNPYLPIYAFMNPENTKSQRSVASLAFVRLYEFCSL